MPLKNKRGDIPVTILVIGVVAICGLAIFSFIDSADKIQESFVGPGLIENILEIKEEMRFEEKDFSGFEWKAFTSDHEISFNDIKSNGNSIMSPFTLAKAKNQRGQIAINVDGDLIKGTYRDRTKDKLLVYVEYNLP